MTHEEAKAKLQEIGKLDQQYREQWNAGKEVWGLQEQLDEKNMSELLKIVDAVGWPTIPKVGEEAAYVAILVAQHSRDIDASVKLLEIAKDLFQKDKESIDGKKLSNWVDAMNMQRRMPQIYGQYMINRGNGYEFYDIDDPQNLDSRRKTMGLEPFEERVRRIINEHPEDRDTLLASYKQIFGKEFK